MVQRTLGVIRSWLMGTEARAALAAALDAEIAARMEKYAGMATAVPDYEDVEVVMREIQAPRENPPPDHEPHPE